MATRLDQQIEQLQKIVERRLILCKLVRTFRCPARQPLADSAKIIAEAEQDFVEIDARSHTKQAK